MRGPERDGVAGGNAVSPREASPHGAAEMEGAAGWPPRGRSGLGFGQCQRIVISPLMVLTVTLPLPAPMRPERVADP